MRQGSTGRRLRGRPNRNKQHGGPPRPNSFDSISPEGRIRGNAHQIYERYLGLARDALSSGDRIAAETFYQHAEHYFRVLNQSTDPQGGGYGQAGRQGGNGHAGDWAQGDDSRTAGSRDPAAGGGPRGRREDERQAVPHEPTNAGRQRSGPRQPRPAEPDGSGPATDDASGNEPAEA